MTIRTYLFFDGRCEEAIHFYGEVFGAEVSYLMRYKDGPQELLFPGGEDKIFHATLTFGETILNLNDVGPSESVVFNGFALIVHIESVEVAERAFGLLATHGEVRVPLNEAFWAARYGIVKDKFGVTWKVQVDK